MPNINGGGHYQTQEKGKPCKINRTMTLRDLGPANCPSVAKASVDGEISKNHTLKMQHYNIYRPNS